MCAGWFCLGDSKRLRLKKALRSLIMAKKNIHKNKLSGEHKQLIINMLGSFFNNKEIIDHFKAEFDIEITGGNVSYYKKHKIPEILEARKKFQKTIVYTPVAQKTWRLRVRQRLIDNLLKEENLWCEEDTKYGTRKKGNHNHINNILDSAREELEPRKVSLTDPTGEKDMAVKMVEAIVEKAKVSAMEYNVKKKPKNKRTTAPSNV